MITSGGVRHAFLKIVHPPFYGIRAAWDRRGGSGFLDRCDEWSFCLTAARMVAEQERR
jgi:hypothetical protein